MASQARQLADKSIAPPGRRNLIINGAMNVAQRGTSKTGVTTSGYYACDRARTGLTTLGTWTVSQENDAPDGFSNSYKVLCTTADASPAAGDLITGYEIRLEGQDLQHLKYGTSDAKTLTLSFWVKSNKTGNASFQCMQLDNANRNASFQYTINSANTWEYKTIVIPADTSGSFDDNNGLSFYGAFWLNSGSTYTGGSHQTTWAALDQSTRNASNLGVGGAVNDYWQVTGVQLEVGSTATEFEHRSYGEELALCQRYFEYIADKNHNAHPCWIYSSSGASSRLFFRVDKRTRTYSTGVEGTIGGSSTDHRFYSKGAYRTFTGISADSSSSKSHGSCRLDFSGLSGVVSGDSGGYYNTGSDVTTSNIYVDDEL